MGLVGLAAWMLITQCKHPFPAIFAKGLIVWLLFIKQKVAYKFLCLSIHLDSRLGYNVNLRAIPMPTVGHSPWAGQAIDRLYEKIFVG